MDYKNMTLNELHEAFKDGTLSEEEEDFLIYDKPYFELVTEKKGFKFKMHIYKIAIESFHDCVPIENI